MYSVLVLMSTYNGDSYLEEQIESILNQEGVNVFILIRDDGSSDKTCAIIEHYLRRNSNISLERGENVGFVKSFSKLLEMARMSNISADYYAFSDQDDIWFNNKLLLACQNLASCDNSKPNLFTSNSMLINSEGKELYLFHKGNSCSYGRGSVLLYGTEQGCSMVFNRRAVEFYCQNMPKQTWHDRWMFFICFYLGNFFYYNQPLFYYRVHGGNTLANDRIGFWRYIKKQFSSFLKKPLHLLMAEEFYSAFNEYISTSDKSYFITYFSYRYNLLSKFKLLFFYEFRNPLKVKLHDSLSVLKILVGRM